MKLAILVSLFLGASDLCLSESSEKSCPRVNTPLGQIEGTYNTSFGGRLYEAYEGLPYALPPTGDMRFEVPRGVLPWKDVLMAKEFGPQCIQYNFLQPNSTVKIFGSEDCLYLNVYTPVKNDDNVGLNGTKLLPVIFFIHSGGFLVGAGSIYGPSFLLDRDVILVTFNYRLGPLGFLSTEDNVAPGNMGMKDQVAALRWVNDNIEYFGGDSSSITIIGHSAGGVSVHYHYMSKLTENLFQRGMSMSGTALAPWALIENPLEKAKKLAGIVGCPTDDNQSMVDCLKTQPAEEIVGALSEFMDGTFVGNGWGPSVEKGGNECPFIDRRPADIIASGDVHDVPWVTGVVSEEGLVRAIFYLVNPNATEELNEGWETIAPYLLYFNDTIPTTDRSKVAELIKEHYLEGSAISRSSFNHFVRMLTDRIFYYGLEKAAKSKAQSNRSPVYIYYCSYRGAHSFTEVVTGSTENFGVSHLDDLAYIMESFFDPTSTPEDRAMQQVLIDLLVSYATEGTPNVGVKWPRLTQSSTDEFSYLHIAGPKKIGMESASNFGDKNFWRNIPFDENILQSSNVYENESFHI